MKPSLTGYISKGIALCGKNQILNAMKALDIAFMFTNEDSKIIHFLLLIKASYIVLAYSLSHIHRGFKAVVLFNANQHHEAILRVQELAAACPDADILACRIVEVSIMCSTKFRSVC